MALTCLILDDEEICVNQLRKYIEKVPTLTLKAYFTNPNEALLYLEHEKVDVIFLDMEMPNYALDGLDVIRILGDSQNYIFTTAYPKYASPSYEYNAVDFLEKPIRFERFTMAIHRVKQMLTIQTKGDTKATDKYTFVRVDGNFQRVDFNDLCWVESERNGIWFCTETNRYYSALPISDIEARLPKNQFIRVHKSFIIPISKAEVINRETISIRRQGKLQEIPIGDTYRKEFITSIENKVIKR
ncbi:LytR/AlgR family response regulator transcription factor [Spirosoma linguale]|uniref:Two component transcriptional regulator, LytTR family n=1 Tax=Spirosoma linguale (strain ATCC 33905 / DSM 74 / LMG 10896 / Claus 1) TaxID=504472 RepID=D2QUZ4_SPILD|nr:two component transcriptional regulator, LytTR family [Spirosoma linguale DSM 74]